MKLEESFTVDAPVGQVWEALIDVERVAPCLPGAELTGADEEGIYRGQFTVKLGPTTAAYRGSLKVEQLDEPGRTATMSARGTDKRGQGGASATIVSTLVEEGERTRVNVATDFTITGRLAGFGRGGMIEDVSRRLLRDFAGCLQTMVTAQPAAEGVAGRETAAAGEAPAAGEAGTATAAEPSAPGGAPPVAEPSAPGGGAPVGEPSPPRPGPSAPPGPAPPAGEGPPRPRPAGPPAKPVRAIPLLLGALWDRLRRLLGRR